MHEELEKTLLKGAKKIGPETYVVKITKDSEDEEVDEELTEETIEEGVSSDTTEADSYDEAEIIKTQKFISACKAGDMEQVKKLLDEGVNINCKEGEGFVQAVGRRHYKLCEYLISQGADVNAKNGVPMLTALIAEDWKMISMLLNKGADPNKLTCDLIKMALQSINFNLVKNFVEHGADVNADNGWCLHHAVLKERLDWIDYFFSVGADPNAGEGRALITAIKNNKMPIIKKLLRNGADIHIADDAPIRLAQSYGMFGLLDLFRLIDNINGEKGQKEFINACKASDTEVMQELFVYGFKPKPEDISKYMSVLNDQPIEVIDLFVSKSGLKPENLEDGFIDSIQSGDIDKIKYYIEKGVDPCCKDFDAFYTACVVENEDVLEYLCAHTDKVKWFKYNNETYIFFTEDQIVFGTTIEATLDELNNFDPDLKNYVENMLAA